jgi:hypothetical protein
LDRLYYNIADPQNIAAADFCGGCGFEMYPGDEAYSYDETVYCEDCFDGMLRIHKKGCRIDVGN